MTKNKFPVPREIEPEDTCAHCEHRMDEECSINGHEVYLDTPACDDYDEVEEDE